MKYGEGEVGFEMVTKNQLKKTFALIPSEWKRETLREANRWPNFPQVFVSPVSRAETTTDASSTAILFLFYIFFSLAKN